MKKVNVFSVGALFDLPSDLASLAIPVLVVVGLMLLFPTYVNLTTVRRSFADAGPVELLEKIKDVAQAVLEDSDVLTKYD